MDTRDKQTFIKENVIMLSAAMALAYWVLESLLHIFIFTSEKIGNPWLPNDLNELWSRGLVCSFFVLFGIYSRIKFHQHRHIQARLAESEAKYHEVADALRENAEKLEQRVREQTLDISRTVGSLQEEVITRINVENALRESENYNRALFEQLPIGLALCRMDGRLVDVNPAYARIIGRTIEETLSLTYWDITPPKYAPQEQMQLDNLNKTGRYGPYEKEYIHKDGRLVPVRLSGRIIQRHGEQFIWSSVEDITARKQAEEDLQKAYAELEMRVRERTAQLQKLNESLEQEIAEHKKIEGQLKLMHFSIDHSHAEFFWTDRDANFIFVNDYACKMLGYSREELLKLKVFDIDPNYPAQRWPSHWEELKQHGSLSFESQHRTKDGALIPLEIRVNYLEFGGQEYNFAVAQDISERKSAEDKIKTLAKIPSENPYPIIRIGWDGKVLYANEVSQPYLAQWDLQVGSVAPENIRKVMSEAVEECAKQEIELAHSGRIFSFVVTPVMDSCYCNLYARDITENKRAGEELLKVNRALWVLSQCNQIMVRAREETDFLNAVCTTIVDYGGYRLVWVGIAENGVNNLVSPVAHAGYEAGYLSEVKIAWDDSELGQAPAGRAIRTGQVSICKDMLTDPAYAPWRQEVIKRGYASSIALPLIDGGLTMGALSIYAPVPDAFTPEEVELLTELANDVAYGIRAIRTRLEREKAEAASKRLNRELVRKNKELESIIFIASHDLRSALVNVQGFSKELGLTCEAVHTALSNENISNALKEQLQKPLKEDIPEAVEFITNSTAKIDALLNGLLRLSRVGREDMNVVWLDMNAIMAEIIKAMQLRITQANARIEAELLPPCMGDYSLISQVFSSLIDNSIKFLDKARPGLIRITAVTKEGQAIYCVDDNGIGIPSEYQSKVFELFHRLVPDETPGEGLGLTIVRQIVERHNGRVWIESEYGKGSKFFVSLPAADTVRQGG